VSFLTDTSAKFHTLLDVVRNEINKKPFCDHQVGICYCRERQAIEDAAIQLAEVDKLVALEASLPKYKE
jgi:hypothetical protein